MGATRMRLRRVVPRIVRGWKSFGVGVVVDAGVPGEVMCWGVKYSRSGTPTLSSGGGAILTMSASAGILIVGCS